MASRISWTDEAVEGKWCPGCETSKPPSHFHKDRSRPDGRTDRCAECRSSNTGTRYAGPVLAVRRRMKAIGLAWCRDCEDWLPVGEIKASGLCGPHTRERGRVRYAADPEYRHRQIQHVRSRKREVAPLPSEASEHLKERFEGRCAYCPNPATTWDHIVPVSKGGETVMGNIVPACSPCNSSKKATSLDEWARRRGLVVSLDVIELVCLQEGGAA